MTNYEYLIKHASAEEIKSLMVDTFGVVNDKATPCENIECCRDCKFLGDWKRRCAEQRKEWLDQEHEETLPYKLGTILEVAMKDYYTFSYKWVARTRLMYYNGKNDNGKHRLVINKENIGDKLAYDILLGDVDIMAYTKPLVLDKEGD